MFGDRRGSDVDEGGVEPHVLVIRREQESPPGWKRQVGNGIGAPLCDVLNVERYEELGIVTVFTTPQIPTVGTGLGWMSKTAQRQGVPSNIERNAELGSRRGWLSPRLDAPTHITLDRPVIRRRHKGDLARTAYSEVPIPSTRPNASYRPGSGDRRALRRHGSHQFVRDVNAFRRTVG